MEIASRRVLPLLLALVFPAGCQSETVARTEVLVVVDSDLMVPAQLDRIDVHVEGPSGPVQSSSAPLGTGASSLPRSVGLVHEGGPLGPLHATVQGMLAGQVVLTRQAQLSFVAGQTLVLPLHLVARCLGVACGQQTCGELGCTSAEVDPLSLDPYAGVEPRLALDAGGGVAADAAAPRDAGRSDGGVVPRPDGGAKADAGACLPMPEVCNALDDDCDGRVDNGFDTSSDSNHCGACGNRCTSGRRCCAGTCRSTCN